MSAVKISVVITTRNRARWLAQALRAIYEQDFPAGRYELVIVDNASTDDTPRVVRDAGRVSAAQVRYVCEPRVGLHYARHAGARHAAGEIVAYTEDDIVLPASWLQTLQDCFEDSTVHAVAGGLRAKWEATPPQWLKQVGVGYLGMLELGPGTFELPRGSYFCGGNFAIRRSTLFAVGGFNPDLLPPEQLHLRGDGEVGLLNKLRRRDLKILYSDAATVEHVVTEEKLSKEYVYRRFEREGISRAFELSRRFRGNVFLLLADATISLIRLGRYRVWSAVSRDDNRRVSIVAFAQYLRARANHGLRLVGNPELRRYTLQKDFLDS